MTFTEACVKYHTPKVPCDGNPNAHHYGPTYERCLAGQQIQRILEIGCGYEGLFHADYQRGGSLLMWEELYPEAEIFGIDIREDALRNERRIRSFLCDQADEAALRCVADNIGGELDLVIDDGSHDWEDIKRTARVFLPRLSENGLYIVEDVVRGVNYDEFPGLHTVIEHGPNTWDDRLIVACGDTK